MFLTLPRAASRTKALSTHSLTVVGAYLASQIDAVTQKHSNKPCLTLESLRDLSAHVSSGQCSVWVYFWDPRQVSLVLTEALSAAVATGVAVALNAVTADSLLGVKSLAEEVRRPSAGAPAPAEQMKPFSTPFSQTQRSSGADDSASPTRRGPARPVSLQLDELLSRSGRLPPSTSTTGLSVSPALVRPEATVTPPSTVRPQSRLGVSDTRSALTEAEAREFIEKMKRYISPR